MTIPSLPSGAHRIGKSWKVWAAGGSFLVLVTTIVVALTVYSPTDSSVPLDPDSTAHSGSRALAQVLERNGVDVRRYTKMPPEQSGAVTVLVSDHYVTDRQLRSVRESDGDLVLIMPSAYTLHALELGLVDAPIDTRGYPTFQAGCDADAVKHAPQLRGSWQPVAVEPDLARAAQIPVFAVHRCFAVGQREDMVAEEMIVGYGYLELRQGDRTVHVVGNALPFRNQSIAEEDNAAFAVNLLGQYESVNWWMAQPTDIYDDDISVDPLWDMIVAWWWWLVVMFLTLWMWGGRRFGKVVREKLPVHVASVEATQGLATLYRRCGATARAAELLRAGTLRALAQTLGVPRGSNREEVLAAAAARLGEPVEHVSAVFEQPVVDAKSLAVLDQDLQNVVRRVRVAQQCASPNMDLPSLAKVLEVSSVSISENHHNTSGEH